ncbi:MAG: hypothetical protein K2X60_05005 [Xanthobacteraceae bacterium]|nr:hypothetical protein [Xanthobacteraceae bacterium]
MRNPWRWLLGFNVLIIVISLVVKVAYDLPNLTYIHLLVDYHFGFAKRALIGELLSLFMSNVPPWMVFALGGTIIAITLALYLRLFAKTFGFSESSLPLFVLIFGSPFFFKNFVKCIGYFDIYGCALAIVLLLIPARSLAFVALATAGSVILILIHQIHMLLYIPTIAAIVIIRYVLVRPATPEQMWTALAFAALIPAAFLYVQFAGVMPVPQEEFKTYLTSRMNGHGLQSGALYYLFIWYQGVSDEVAGTWQQMRMNLVVSWFYVLLIVLHAPLAGYFKATIRAIASLRHRRIVLVLLGAITLGYTIIFVTVYDYARWVAAWGVCMILMLHAIRQLPGAANAPLIAPDDKRAFTFATVLTLLPRVGITRPF